MGVSSNVDRSDGTWSPLLGFLASVFVLAALALPSAFVEDADAQVAPTITPVLQPAGELVSTEGSVASQLGISVSLSSDGRTALAGAPEDSGGQGAAWVFVKTESGWDPQATELVAEDAVGQAKVGYSVALSADGDVAIVGAVGDDGDRGAAWIFTRNGGTWTQSGPKLEPSDAEPEPHSVLFGGSVALSADGSTALIGGYGDRFGGYGGAWVFVRSGNTWVQQGPKLAPVSEQLGADGYYAWFGFSVALSADGNTALVGGEHDEERIGAAWVFARSGSEWTQQGPELVSGAPGAQLFGDSVSLSADGDTAVVGAEETNGGAGAAWTFTREGASWVRSEFPPPPPDLGPGDRFGRSVAIDPSGMSAVVGASAYEFGLGLGVVWTYSRAGPGWSQPTTPMTPSFSIEERGSYGYSVATAANGATALIGGPTAHHAGGVALVFEAEPGTRTFKRMQAYGAAALPPQSGIEAQVGFEGEITGTVTWKWYGPDTTSCAGPPLGTVTSAISADAGFSSSFVEIPTNGLGNYLLVASYSGDSHTMATASGCGAADVEMKSWPTLETAVQPAAAHVGSAIQIVPTLLGAHEPTGTVGVLIFDNSSCSGTPVMSQTADVMGEGKAQAIEYVPVTTGKLFIYARYSGDSNNFGISTKGCDEQHAVVVSQAEPTLALNSSPARVVGESISTEAHLHGGYVPSGVVKFELFAPIDQTCAGSPVATVSVLLTAGGAASSGPFATTATGDYHFVAAYAGDADNRAGTTACRSATAEVVPRRAVLGVAGVADVAGYGTLEGTASLDGGFLPTGNVTFSLFRAGQSCHGQPLIAVLTALNRGRATTGALGPVPAGRYTFRVSYTGDQDNVPLDSGCGATTVVIPTLLLRASSTSTWVRVILRCVGVAVARCTGTIDAVLHSRTLGRFRYSVPKGRTTTRLLKFDSSARKVLRAGRYKYLTLAIRLGESGQSQTVQHMRIRLRSR